jgi:hypothetical protein
MNTEHSCPNCGAVLHIRTNSPRPLAVGDVIDGYCGGYFGDSYGRKVVEHLGRGYVVLREDDVPMLSTLDHDTLIFWRDHGGKY